MKKIEIKVIPNSKEESITEGEPLVVRVKSPPLKGRANKAALKLLSGYFNAEVRLVRGEKSRKKVVEIDA